MANSERPSLGSVIASLPTDVNPYSFLANLIERLNYPAVDDSVYRILLAFAIVYAFVILVCISLIIIPFSQGPSGRKRHFWLIRKRYLPNKITPLIIPNAGIVVTISQLVASLVFEFYIVISYQSLKSPEFAQRSYRFVWLQMCWLPGYFGFWFTAWNAMTTYICSPKRNLGARGSKLLNPTVLNWSGALLLVFVAIQAVTGAVFHAFVCHQQSKSFVELYHHLNVAAAGWPSNVKVNMKLLSLLFDAHQRTSDDFIRVVEVTAYAWVAIGAIAAIFYAATVVMLLRLTRLCLRNGSNNRKPQRVQIVGDRDYISAPISVHFSKERSTVPQRPKDPLEKGYLFLIGHCSLMLIGLVWDIGVGIVVASQTRSKIHDPQFRGVAVWITVIGAGFISIAMLFQSWRNFTDRDVINNIHNSQIDNRRQVEEDWQIDSENVTGDSLGQELEESSESRQKDFEGGVQWSAH